MICRSNTAMILMLDKLKASFDGCPVVDMHGYKYFVHPITDGVPAIDPDLLDEVTDRMIELGDFDCDLILAPEAMGIPLATAISTKMGTPYAIIRKKKYGLPGEVSIAQYTGYSKSDMFINGVSAGSRVTVVDDVISTGGTMKAIINALKNIIGAEIADIVVVMNKGGKDEIEKEFDVEIKTLIDVSVSADGKVVYK